MSHNVTGGDIYRMLVPLLYGLMYKFEMMSHNVFSRHVMSRDMTIGDFGIYKVYGYFCVFW
jgi:hypothetical protein